MQADLPPDSIFSKFSVIFPNLKDAILLVIGPSGTGKTSLSLSVKARPLQRISLGGWMGDGSG